MYSIEHVLSETKKLQYVYQLKREIRYELNRTEREYSESVAEHIFGMHTLAQYFLPLEDKAKSWDWLRIYQMITWHDLEEVETGDTIAYLKKPEHQQVAATALETAVNKLPAAIKTHVSQLTKEYVEQITPEAKFTRAVDKFEPLIHLYCEEGKKVSQNVPTPYEERRKYKLAAILDFPVIHSFADILLVQMNQEGFFDLTK